MAVGQRAGGLLGPSGRGLGVVDPRQSVPCWSPAPVAARTGRLVPHQDGPPPDGLRPIAEYNVANDFRTFIVNEPRPQELRRQFESYIGPVQGEPVI